MKTSEFDAEAYIDAVAPATVLDIRGERRAQVATFLTIAKEMAGLLDAAPVPGGTLDLAPVFDPTPAGGGGPET